MKYLNTSRINQISLLAGNYFKAVEICLLVNDGEISQCNTKAKIKFDCDDCSIVKKHILHDRVSIVITKDRFSACAVYRQDCDRKYKLVLNNKKVCAKIPPGIFCEYGAAPLVNPIPIFPLKVCSSSGDCSTGETCRKWTGLRGPNLGCDLPLPP